MSTTDIPVSFEVHLKFTRGDELGFGYKSFQQMSSVEMLANTNEMIDLRDSPLHGKGVFANRAIATGTHLTDDQRTVNNMSSYCNAKLRLIIDDNDTLAVLRQKCFDYHHINQTMDDDLYLDKNGMLTVRRLLMKEEEIKKTYPVTHWLMYAVLAHPSRQIVSRQTAGHVAVILDEIHDTGDIFRTVECDNQLGKYQCEKWIEVVKKYYHFNASLSKIYNEIKDGTRTMPVQNEVITIHLL